MDASPSRKRLRRNTRSCYQCRKRKVKCQLTDEDVETCAECVKSRTRCTLQAPETESSSGGSPAHGNEHEHAARLERIESLLKRLVEAREQSQPVETQPAVSDSLWNDFLLHSGAANGNPPLIGSHDSTTCTPSDSKESLVALLPSAQDAVTIVTNTTAWLWGAETPPGTVLSPNDTFQLLDVAAISKGSAMDVAKTLLLFALYMQQLPASFDVQCLGSQRIEMAMNLITERVKLFLLSHEEELGSLDGLECLTLLSLIHLNDGAMRKAWMSFRRTLDIARLNGLQNSFSLAARNSSSGDAALRRRLWLSTVCGDCYCSLLLGLEPGLGLVPFGPDDETWDDPQAGDDGNVQRRIGLIVARIAQRNAVGLHKDRNAFQELDEALNQLGDMLSPSWWKVPSFRQDRPLDSGTESNRLTWQLWFFQARIFVHMPIAFSGEASKDALCSLESCMEASRMTLHRYIGLQYAKDHLSRCRSVDQSAFLAAAVLLLSKVQLQCHEGNATASKYDSDRALLEQVIDLFETIGKTCGREHVAKQSFDILSTMLSIVDDACAVHNRFDTNTPLEVGIPCDPQVHVGMNSTGMEDIVVCSIQPLLGAQSLASRIIQLWLTTKRSALSVAKYNQELLPPMHTGLSLDGTIDPAIFG